MNLQQQGGYLVPREYNDIIMFRLETGEREVVHYPRNGFVFCIARILGKGWGWGFVENKNFTEFKAKLRARECPPSTK